MPHSPREVLRAWRRVAGPWAPFVWPTLLTEPPHASYTSPDPSIGARAVAWVDEFRATLAADVDAAGPAWRAGAAVVVAGLPALLALASAPVLASRGMHPVAVLRRWPHPQGLLPAGPLVDAYHHYASAGTLRLRRRPRGGVFLVESERLLPLAAQPPEQPASLRTHLDNRYRLDSQDLPRPDRLRAQGITTLLMLVSASEPALASDLRDYSQELTTQGLSVLSITLEALNEMDALMTPRLEEEAVE